ncbi:adenosylcobalamin-dependent ribonucleoside-diphosphate reductase [Patescibacteria group bacterium]
MDPNTSPTATKEFTENEQMTSQNGKKMPDLNLSPTAQTVLEKRYLMKDENGNVIETAYDMFQRVADNIASADAFYGATEKEVKKTSDDFFDLMINLEFLSGMTLRNAGRELQQLSACYVLPVEDSMDSIFDTLRNAAFLHKTGAGVGYDFSSLRPAGAIVSTTGGKSSGPISFMRLYNFSSQTVVGEAGTRKAGNMGIMRVDHPDIMEFITIKSNYDELNHFNVSVAMTDVFMDAVKDDKEYDLIDPHTKEVVAKKRAREVYDAVIERAWTSAEPGLLFIDEVNRCNQTPGVGEIRATNQCGEQPLLPYEACNIGSLVLSRMLKQKDNSKGYEVDWDKLEYVVRKAVHFLDNMIDVNNYPLEKIKEMNFNNRRIGLGVMGFADMLVGLGIPYNSPEAVQMAEKTMKFIQEKGRDESSRIGKKRGNFPNFDKSVFPAAGYEHMRNCTVTTIAPTGTTSIFAGCSSGIEPIFSLVYIRKNILDEDKDEFIEVHPMFEKVAKERWFYSKELMEEIANQGGVENIDEIPEDVRRVFVTSHQIEPEWHVRVQAAFQKYTDNAVSKTVNLPNEATRDDIREVFSLAHELKCKGGTVYRDGSRDKQVLNLKK